MRVVGRGEQECAPCNAGLGGTQKELPSPRDIAVCESGFASRNHLLEDLSLCLRQGCTRPRLRVLIGLSCGQTLASWS